MNRGYLIGSVLAVHSYRQRYSLGRTDRQKDCFNYDRIFAVIDNEVSTGLITSFLSGRCKRTGNKIVFSLFVNPVPSN